MKKGLKKVISGIVVSLLVLILAVGVLFHIFGDAALKAGVETGASKALKVDVSVDAVSLGVLTGKLDIDDLVVANPEGYANPTFLELGQGAVKLNVSSLLSDTVEIDTIRLDNIHLTIEQKGLSNNLKEILDNLPTSETPQEKPEQEKEGKNLLVKQLDIENVKVTVKLLPVPGQADNLTLEVAPIHMENIGSGENVNTPKLVSTVIVAIAKGVAEQGAGILPTEMLNDITGELGRQGMKILQSGADIGSGIIEGGKGAAEQATDALKSLNPFQKKEENEAEE